MNINFQKFALALLMGSSLSTFAQDNLINKVKDNGAAGAEAKFQFETVINNDATPVKDQGRSGTCWSYATSGFVESEMLRMGKQPVDLAEMYVVRKTYTEKADRYVRLHGHLNFSQGGALNDVLDVINKYGIVPQEVYEGLEIGEKRNNHGEMESVLKGIVDGVVANNNGRVTPVWKDAFEGVLNAYLGVDPESFEYKGKTYTPRSFADEVVGINADDYIYFTSWTDAPYYEETQILVPDNWMWKSMYNLPVDEMMEVLDHALMEGYTASFAADVSERGFSLQNGIAIVPAIDYADMSAEERQSMFNGPQAEKVITPENRQAAYDNYETTDDHGMLITGITKDQDGNKYYIVKNSWGSKRGPFEGYLYFSESYLRYKMLDFVIHKDGVPKKTLKKLK